MLFKVNRSEPKFAAKGISGLCYFEVGEFDFTLIVADPDSRVALIVADPDCRVVLAVICLMGARY